MVYREFRHINDGGSKARFGFIWNEQQDVEKVSEKTPIALNIELPLV